MTREKREINKKLAALDMSVEANEAFGCEPPNSFIRWVMEEEDRLLGRMAELQHYDSIGAMLTDDRWQRAMMRGCRV